MTESILDSVKQALGVPVESTDFDSELTMYINSVLSTLNQLGVGPNEGFSISGKEETWSELLGENSKKLNDAKTYLTFKVKLMFDQPPTSFALAAIQEQIKETEWRLNVTRESTDWVNPEPVVQEETLF